MREPLEINIPAICPNCNFVAHSGFSVGTTGEMKDFNTEFSIEYVGAGTCPRCMRATMRIIDGEYKVIGGFIEVVQAENYPKDVIQNILNVLINSINGRLSKNEIVKEVSKESKFLGQLIKKLPKSNTELYAFIGLMISALSLLKSCNSSDDIYNNTIDIDQKIEVIINNYSDNGTTDSVARSIANKLNEDRQILKNVKKPLPSWEIDSVREGMSSYEEFVREKKLRR